MLTVNKMILARDHISDLHINLSEQERTKTLFNFITSDLNVALQLIHFCVCV